MKICPNCGLENTDGQKFCSGCGISLQTDLERLLESLGLGAHWSVFENNDLKTIEDLRLLDDQNFNELGIPYGDKIRIKKALEAVAHQGTPAPVVTESPLDLARTRALQGDLSAMYEIGEIFSEGSEEVEEDPVEAASWYRKAAEKGHAGSQYKYGLALYYGRGVSEDETESARWLRMATRQGHEDAKNEYNERLEMGHFAFLLDSAEQGNADSQYRLGYLFYHGEQGHPVDKAQAALWFRKSAAQGLAAAQYLLGEMYLRGDGIRQDAVEARRLLEGAANQGHPEAIEKLRSMAPAPPSESPLTVPTATLQPSPSQAEIPKKKKSTWQTFVGIAFTLIVIAKIIAFFIPEEKKAEPSPALTPQTSSSGKESSSSRAGIVNMGRMTPIPISRPASFSEQVPAPFVVSTPTSTTVIPQATPLPETTPASLVSSPPPEMPASDTPPNLGRNFVNSLGLRFVPIPGTVTYFSIYDTRISDYQRFVNETGRFWKPAGFPQQANHPAVRANYYDATAFCHWLTDKEHASGALPQGCEYRLPTDLEWSAAAGIGIELEGPPAWRGGGIKNCYAWGSSWPPPPGSGNYDPKLKTDKYPYTSPVGAFPPNRYGLYDMNGNVYQWVKDDYDQSGQGCLRGGSWPDEHEDSINLSNRLDCPKDANFKCYGFRCIIAPIGTESRIATSKLPQ